MTAPNELIHDLTIKAGVMEMGEKIAWGSDTALMRQAAATLQSQAERISELESLNELAVKQAETLVKQRDTLRAQLAEIAATEPVARAVADKTNAGFVYVRVLADELLFGTQLFTRPIPARPQDHEIRELVDRLTAIAKEYGQTQQLRERIAQEIRPFTFTKPAQDKSNNYLNGYCTGRTDLLKEQASPQAQDVTELVELLEFMWRDVSMNEYAFEKLEAALSKYKGGSPMLLNTAAPAPHPAIGDYPGWKLVPIEPTPEMTRSSQQLVPAMNKAVYKAMVAAAPEPQPAQGADCG